MERFLAIIKAILALFSKSEPVEPVEPPVNKPTPTTHYSHYNEDAFNESEPYVFGKGIGWAINFCPDSPKWASVTLNGKALRLHTVDRGREIWTNVDAYFHPAEKRITGTLIMTTKDGAQFSIEIEGNGVPYTEHIGDCFRVYA